MLFFLSVLLPPPGGTALRHVCWFVRLLVCLFVAGEWRAGVRQAGGDAALRASGGGGVL